MNCTVKIYHQQFTFAGKHCQCCAYMHRFLKKQIHKQSKERKKQRHSMKFKNSSMNRTPGPSLTSLLPLPSSHSLLSYLLIHILAKCRTWSLLQRNVHCSSRTSSRGMVGRGQLVDRRLVIVKAHTGEYSVTEHPTVKIDLVIKSEILY